MLIDWETLTPTEARRLAQKYNQHHDSLGPAYEAGEIDEAKWWQPYQVAEALTVFAETGLAPGTYDERTGQIL